MSSGGPLSSGPRSMPFAPGTVLAGKYRIERLLGEGGMGWVVVATHLHLEQRVALKFMRADHAAAHPDAVARFLREARAAARIQSEHVARVSDVGTLDDGSPYLVMEYLEGQDLESLLKSRGALPTQLAIDYALQACEGLAEAHAAGIVHRDLKPANLFLAKRSDGGVRVKLLDFGISKIAPAGGGPDVGMTSTQALMGSPLYMAPEQMRSTKRVDRRADIWSMGIILYEMLGGRTPFAAETLPEVVGRIMTEAPESLASKRADVPAALEAAVTRCLEKDATKRFADVAALAQAIAPFAPAETRVAAERIARLSRASAPSLSDADASGPTIAASTTGNVAPAATQTNALFGTAASAATAKRSAAVPVAIVGGAVVIAAAVIVAVVAMKDARRTDSMVPASAAASAAAAAPPSASQSSPSPSTTTSTITSMTPATSSTSTPTPTASTTATTLAGATARPPPGKAALPVPPPPPAKPAKPATTNGFGGRD